MHCPSQHLVSLIYGSHVYDPNAVRGGPRSRQRRRPLSKSWRTGLSTWSDALPGRKIVRSCARDCGSAIAVSCASLTPIGHKNNTAIMGPGGDYRFSDYWRMGLPLELVALAVAVPMLLWVWPLH